MGIIKYRTDASSPWVEIPALQGSKGEDGKDGIDGATPVKGVDYFTEQEIEEIAEQAAAKVEIPDMAQYALAEHEHEEYLTEHQSLEGYATQEYVDEAVASIDVPEQDLSDYATTEYVDNAVNSIDVPDIDLTGYATERYVDDAVAAVPKYDLTAYATKTYVNTQIDALPEYDMAAYALKSHTHDEYALKANMGAYALKADIPSLDGYAKLADIPEVPDVSAFQTEAQVQALIDASLGVIENGNY